MGSTSTSFSKTSVIKLNINQNSGGKLIAIATTSSSIAGISLIQLLEVVFFYLVTG